MTASSRPETTSITTTRSRRAILAGALGGIGAVVASAVGRASPASAATNDPVLVDNAHTGSGTTQITTSGGTAIRGVTSAALGTAIHGHATSTAPGGWGVWGETDSSEGTGVLGFATSSYGASWGVYGEANSAGGVGVVAWNHSGLAFKSDGRAKFTTSGVATIAAGSTSKTIDPGVNIVGSSFVLLTPKSNLGGRSLWFTTNSTTNKFTIRMSSARGADTKVAWLLLG